MSQDTVVTRFAPSPSGALHLGNARTALFNFLLARKHAGRFVLRIEDTDTLRTQDAMVAALCTDLAWLGLDWDEGPDRPGPHAPYRQSQRTALYQLYFERLEREQLAYPCFCTNLELDLARRAQLAAGQPPRYAGTCRQLTAGECAARLAQGRKPSLRFRVPSGRRIEFEDLVHGAQSYLSDDIGDFIIRIEAANTETFALTVAHEAEPKRMLWETLPCVPFLNAEQGDEKIREFGVPEGSFDIQDHLIKECATQTLTTVSLEGATLVLRGTLSGKNCNTEYEFVFRSVSA
ncbi:MAG: glutamate--tRNA ligase family protein, partial [Steroidobacteraceae bacterium]